ncbi:MAG: nucleotide exchange factor GrpE [Clostridiales bacterium]|jgi:molecular chaperone GrpE|nr:nucleotide exchange factor GrpE [Clostridiales bacterium]
MKDKKTETDQDGLHTRAVSEGNSQDGKEEPEQKSSREATIETQKTEDAEIHEKPKIHVKELQKKLEESEKLLAETKDRMLRIAAEYDNYKKRTARELETRYSDGKADAVKLFLPVSDNFERAISSMESSDIEAIKQGVELIFKQMKDVMSSMGVTEIDSLGEEFDPGIHNAVMHVEGEEFSSNQIVEVFQKGYKIGDRVLRHSMVKVAN